MPPAIEAGMEAKRADALEKTPTQIIITAPA
jgi:hypothetical protein